MNNAVLLLQAIHEKTGGRSRAVRDVTELETGLTAKAARQAWDELLEQGLIERFSQKYAARLSFKGLDFLASGKKLPVLRPATAKAPSVVIARGSQTHALAEVQNFLGERDLESVAIEGPGLMQKMETHHRLAFAVALLTAEDLGSNPSRHVLMDVGLVIGRFGSARICAFAVDAPEAPDDFAGLPLYQFDAAGGWKSVLAAELRKAGLAE